MLPTQEAPTRWVPARGRRGYVSHSCVRPFPCSQPGLSASQGAERGVILAPDPQSWGAGRGRGSRAQLAAAQAVLCEEGGGRAVGGHTEALGGPGIPGAAHRPWSGAASGGWREQRGGTCGGSWARGGAPAAAGGGGAHREGGGVHAAGTGVAGRRRPSMGVGACTLLGRAWRGGVGPAWGWERARWAAGVGVVPP